MANEVTDLTPHIRKARQHWTQTPEGKARLSKALRKAHRKASKTRKGWRKATPVKAAPLSSRSEAVMEAMIYLRHAEKYLRRHPSHAYTPIVLYALLALRALEEMR